MSKRLAPTFNILMVEEGEMYIAHCLELDIVTTAESLNQAKNDIIDLIAAQLSYAFTNNNLDHLYHPAPPEVWRQFYACKEQFQEEHAISDLIGEPDPETFIPPWIIANMCRATKECYV
jgi:hypothetical protein